MNRISKCFRFRIRNAMKSTLGFVLIYTAACYVLIPALLHGAFGRDKTTSGTYNSAFFIGAALFAFAYVISDYRATFNYLLINGNTRKTIFISNMAENAVLSVILAVLTYLSAFADEFVTKNILGGTKETVRILQFIYPDTPRALALPYAVAFFLLLTSFSMLYGSLAYKFGKFFTTAFWVSFGVVIAGLPVSSNHSGITIASIISYYMWLDHPQGILLAPVNFILTALVFTAAAYLAVRRQPQTAPVQ